ncbi:uncharacterized protein TNIN_318771 [Trichonephila inaurata madagascariensis]|uniref:C2H2-type domain-containing protein n=1 Tax=Trichonephila inaurata madagascariensis TaxID=2747483 RepID=A0A8X6XVB3_9ARAC|nr:uncharacterized protein TNIN_318771 [Trichonephila inaurata madagascariensis]
MDNLRRHQSTVHGCPFVQTTSTSESSSRIRVHSYSEMENAASTSPATNDEENTRPIKLSNSTRKKVFNCFECGKVFYQRKSLNQHVKTVQAASSSFLCPVCDKNCVTVHGLIRHLNMHATNGEENVPSTSTENKPPQMEVGNVPLTKRQKSNLTPLKTVVRKLGDRSIPLYKKRHLLVQKGEGFLSFLIPAALSVLSSLFNELMLVPEERLQKFAQYRLFTLDKQIHTILERKNITDEEKATLYLQILQKFVNFPYLSTNPDIMETVDTKQENYQNQSTDTVEDKINTITSLSPKEHAKTRPKEETSADTIEEEIGSIAPVKCKNIPKKILNFIQQNQGGLDTGHPIKS